MLFTPRKLLARLKAVLSRTDPLAGAGPTRVRGLCLDPNSHRVTIHDDSVDLGPTEYRLLEFFLTHQDPVYTRGQMLDHVWGGNVYLEERTVDDSIHRLHKAHT